MRSIMRLLSARSPFGAMQAHMDKVAETASLLRPLMEAVRDGQQDKVLQMAQRIQELERECDDIYNDIRDHLPKSIFLPVGRRDVLEILRAQDSVADASWHVAETLTLKPLRMPPQIETSVFGLIDCIEHICSRAQEITRELDNLLAASFGGPEAETVFGMITALDGEETATDRVVHELARGLFGLEGELSPVEIMVWYEAVRAAQRVVGYAKQVGNRVRLLIARV